MTTLKVNEILLDTGLAGAFLFNAAGFGFNSRGLLAIPDQWGQKETE